MYQLLNLPNIDENLTSDQIDSGCMTMFNIESSKGKMQKLIKTNDL